MNSWLPTFLNWQVAAKVAAVAAPVLVLLYFLKLRRREVVVSSTFLWRRAVQDLQVNAPFQKLRKNLLLLLQLLAILFLCGALARPVIRRSAVAGKVAVILIDRSASMSARDCDGHSRLEEAKIKARELVDSMDKDASAMVIAFDDAAQTIQPFTSDKPALLHAIDSIVQTDRRSALKQAYDLAEAQGKNIDPDAERTEQRRAELWLLSDGRVSDADKLALAKSDLKWIRIGTDTARNVGIVNFRAARSYEQPVKIDATVGVANFGPDPVETSVKLSVSGQDVPQVASVLLLPNRWTQEQAQQWQQEQIANHTGKIRKELVPFSLELSGAAVLTAEIAETDGDMLAADNVARVVVPPAKALTGMLVTKGNYFLDKVIHSVNVNEPVVRTPASYEQMLAEGKVNVDLIVFDNYSPQALPPAGNFIFFGGAPPDSQLRVLMKDGEPDRIAERSAVLTWKADHPILRDLNLRTLAAQNMAKLQLPREAMVLVDGTAGPMVVLYREGRRTFLLTSFALLDSTWPTNVTFPAFVNHAVQYLGIGAEMELRQSLAPGATPTIPRWAIQQLGDVNKLQLSGPMGKSEITIPANRDLALPPLDKVGLYTLDPPVPQYEKLAVNLVDENESNLVPPSKPPVAPGVAAEQVSGKSRMELWWWLVAAVAIPLLLVEWWVYTRRVHL